MNSINVNKIYNHPVELSLRALVILSTFNKPLTLNQLVNLDYLVIFSKDIGGPNNLHPTSPKKTSQILIKRKTMQVALQKLLSKELIQLIVDPEEGILYASNNLTESFISYFESSYAKTLIKNTEWIFITFNNYSEEKLEQYISNNIEDWGNEFIQTHQSFGEINE